VVRGVELGEYLIGFSSERLDSCMDGEVVYQYCGVRRPAVLRSYYCVTM
jgi:hypothetical protein